MLGAALGPRRKDVIVATKVRGRMGDGPNELGLSRVHIMQQCEASLKRLGTDYIDLSPGVDGDDAGRPRAGHDARLEPVRPEVTGGGCPRRRSGRRSPASERG